MNRIWVAGIALIVALALSPVALAHEGRATKLPTDL